MGEGIRLDVDTLSPDSADGMDGKVGEWAGFEIVVFRSKAESAEYGPQDDVDPRFVEH